MPRHLVHCPCGKTSLLYRGPNKPDPKYCNIECRIRYHRGRRTKYFFSPEMDAEIRKLYLNEAGMKSLRYTGPVKQLAAKFKIPRWAVSRRATQLGILPVQKKEPNWCPREIAILEQSQTPSSPIRGGKGEIQRCI